MKDIINTVTAVVFLIALLGAGGGVLVWLAPVPTAELTAAQSTLIELADTAVKGTLGAIFGFVSAVLTMRNGRRD